MAGELIQVNPGDTITSRIYCGSDPGGTHSYCAQISSSGGGGTSQVVVQKPVMGKNEHYQDSFGTSDQSYYEFQLGDLWESENMDSASQFPKSFTTNPGAATGPPDRARMMLMGWGVKMLFTPTKPLLQAVP